MTPRLVATRLLGAIDWQTEVSGFCTCPGELLHTSHNGKRDCRECGRGDKEWFTHSQEECGTEGGE